MLSLPLGWLNLPARVNLQTPKMKMVKLETRVTVAEQRLGQLRSDVGNVFEVVPSKTHEWNMFWLVICRDGPVLGKNGDFGVLGCLQCYELVYWLVTTC